MSLESALAGIRRRLPFLRAVRRSRQGRAGPRPWPSEAVSARLAYEHRLGEIATGGTACGPPLDLHVVSFSSEHDLPEQVASVRSFLTKAGTPSEFTIVSDGSHSARSRDLLQAVHPCIEVVDWRSLVRPGLSPALWEYARASWRGQKVMVLVSLSVERPVLYADADILFFDGACELRELAQDAGTAPRYLRDCNGGRQFLDRAMLRNEQEGRNSLNAGFMFLPERPDWSPALARLDERLRERPALFTGQTVVHLTLHRAGATPFDRARYVMADDDGALAEDPYVGPLTVLRHYVTPIRHKFWMMLSRLPAAG